MTINKVYDLLEFLHKILKKGTEMSKYGMPANYETSSTSGFNFSTSYAPAFVKNLFAFNSEKDLIQINYNFSLTVTPLELMQITREKIDSKSLITIVDNDLFLLGKEFILVIKNEDDDKSLSALKKAKNNVNINIISTPELANTIEEIVKEYRKNEITIELWYYVDNRARQINLPVEPYGEYHTEFYPWLEDDYFQKYLKSQAMILFLSGIPGSGKTSVLRNFILTNRLNTITTYDEEVLKREQIFIDFMTDEEKDVLIAEDADALLTDRARFGNNIVSKFLNYSEGLVKFPKKKIIFTTNLHEFDRVDPALTRPGRCFGNKISRALTYQESLIAAILAGIERPIEERSHTIAELMAYKEGQTNTIKQRKVGF